MVYEGSEGYGAKSGKMRFSPRPLRLKNMPKRERSKIKQEFHQSTSKPSKTLVNDLEFTLFLLLFLFA